MIDIPRGDTDSRGRKIVVLSIPGPPRTRIKRTTVSVQFAQSKRLQRRLKDPIWEKNGSYYDPKDNTRMHRPGSQKRS